MNDPRIAALLMAIAALAGYLAIITVMLRSTGHAFAVTVLCGAAVGVFCLVVAAEPFDFSIWHFSALYSCGIALVIFIYGAVLKSLSLRMALFTASRPAKCSPVDVLSKSIITPAFDERISILERKKLICRIEPGTYVTTPKGRRVATQISNIRHWLAIEGNGLYGS
jgi:hypothetical protein